MDKKKLLKGCGILILLACGILLISKITHKENIPTGYYFFSEIHIITAKNQDEKLTAHNGRPLSPEKFAEWIEDKVREENNDFYLHYTEGSLYLYDWLGEKSKIETTTDTLVLNNNTYHFSVSHDGKLTLTRGDMCFLIDCKGVLTLDFSRNKNEKITAIEEQQKKSLVELKANYQHDKQQIAQNKFISDFIGQKIVQKPMSIKLPIDYILDEGDAYFLKNLLDENTINKYKNVTSTWIVHGNRYDIRVAYIKAEDNPFDINKIVKSDAIMPESVVYQEKQGAIYYDQNNNLTAVYTTYDKKEKEYCVAFAEGMKKATLDEIAKKYAIIKTLSAEDMGELLTPETASMAPKQFEDKFGKLFDSEALAKTLREELKNKLIIENLIQKQSSGIDGTHSFKFMPEFKDMITVHSGNISDLKREIENYYKLDDEKLSWRVGYQDEHVLIMEHSAQELNYISYYFIEDKGLIYQIAYNPFDNSHENEGTLADHLRVINSLRQLPEIKENHYSTKFITQHVGKYSNAQKLDEHDGLPIGLTQYLVALNVNNQDRWGALDSAGNMIINIKYTIEVSDWGYLVSNLDKCTAFKSGAVFCAKGLIDYKGHVLVPAKYKYIEQTDDALVLISSDGKKTLFKH